MLSKPRLTSPRAFLETAANSWSTNIHEQVAALDQRLWQACCAAQPPRRPNKRYLNDAAWTLVLERKAAKKQIRALAARSRRLASSAFFRAWKYTVRGRRGANVNQQRAASAYHRMLGARNDLEQAVYWHRRLLKPLRSSIADSKADYLRDLAKRFEDAVGERDSHELFHALKPFRPPGKKVFKPFGPATTLTDEQGRSATTHAEQQELHRRHFQQQEAGEVTTVANYCALPAPPPPDACCPIEELPTLYEVEAMIRSSKDGRAPGPSGVPSCVWKTAPTEAAHALLPVFVKANIRLCEPVQYRGCKLVALLKKLGNSIRADNFRSIALFDAAAKYYHKTHRGRLVSEIERYGLPLLQGCVPGSGPVSLTHILSTHLGIARRRKESAAILFLDLRAAYYRLLRQAVTGARITDGSCVNYLLGYRFSPVTFTMWRAQRRGPDSFVLPAPTFAGSSPAPSMQHTS